MRIENKVRNAERESLEHFGRALAGAAKLMQDEFGEYWRVTPASNGFGPSTGAAVGKPHPNNLARDCFVGLFSIVRAGYEMPVVVFPIEIPSAAVHFTWGSERLYDECLKPQFLRWFKVWQQAWAQTPASLDAEERAEEAATEAPKEGGIIIASS